MGDNLMSELTVNSLTNQDISLCKAWVNFNGRGTVAIRSSYNVSSITDNGTGDYTVNLAIAMNDINYTAIAGGSDVGVGTFRNINSMVATTSSFDVGAENTSGGSTDTDHMYAMVFGN